MGPLVSTHPVGLKRRRPLGLAAVAMALISALLLVLMFFIDLNGFQYVLVFAAYPLLISTPIAITMLRPRVPQTFELYEGGLAHVRDGRRREWTWEQVRAIDVLQNGPISRSGAGIDCTVRFDDGEVVRFDGFTENAGEIAGALGDHCAEAARVPVRPQRLGRLVTVLGGITVGGAGVATWAILTVPHTAEGGDQFGLAMLAVACVVPAVISLILLISVLVHARR
ncbi:hypothetical protein ACIA8G_42200 [Lentzea sp. NPDC051213]|uniref:hypothetical protein n=1 Tax=Lentzea sp. NPDC051213 TaxID=3364126 RepID=UPI0037A96F68